ncbi:transposable element Tcb2 transposase [Trichonephila clavipes]|nr:transposable element Tcb2 transposase [Trichonephila clavipes]
MEAGWSARQIARQLGRSDCVMRKCWDQWIRQMSFTQRPSSEQPLTHQSSRRPSHQRCHAREDWTAAKFNQVIFSDESRFNLSSDDNHVLVWRPRGECHNPAFALQRHTFLQLMISQGYLRTAATLPWPSRPPDLSPIEHIWDHLGRRVGHPMSLNELEAILQQIWNEMLKTSYRTCML